MQPNTNIVLLLSIEMDMLAIFLSKSYIGVADRRFGHAQYSAVPQKKKDHLVSGYQVTLGNLCQLPSTWTFALYHTSWYILSQDTSTPFQFFAPSNFSTWCHYFVAF